MFKVLCALMLIPALSFAAPKHLAEKKFPVEPEINATQELAKLFNEEFAREGSPLRKALADVIKDNSDESGPRLVPVDADDILHLESGGSGGLYSTEFLIPLRAGYKSNTTIEAYVIASEFISFRDDDGVTIRLDRRVKVTIK